MVEWFYLVACVLLASVLMWVLAWIVGRAFISGRISGMKRAFRFFDESDDDDSNGRSKG